MPGTVREIGRTELNGRGSGWRTLLAVGITVVAWASACACERNKPSDYQHARKAFAEQDARKYADEDWRKLNRSEPGPAIGGQPGAKWRWPSQPGPTR
jgi:hypothetical protein